MIYSVKVYLKKGGSIEMIHATLEKIGDVAYICPEISGMNPIRYEVVNTEKLYETIYKGVPLALDQVCIEGFSIEEYRKKYGFGKEDIVEIKVDYIINSIFCGKNGIAADFSWCKMIAVDAEAGIMLDDNIFYYGKVDFSYSDIGNVDFSMKGCRFINCNMYFGQTVFGNKGIYFDRTEFGDEKCEVVFSGTDFGEEGEVSFDYMKRINGSVEFYDCNFGAKHLSFAYMDCPEAQFSFWEVETPPMTVDFVDSVVRMILMYKANVNGLLDFRISQAEHIVIQESVIRDCVLLGNQGYKNYTCYCLKKSTLLGRLRIQNKFSKHLFHKQLQYVYDPIQDEIVLCPTSATDKANQLIILSENYQNEGESDNADAAYVLSKRYRSVGRVHDVWTDYAAVGRTEEYGKSIIKKSWAYFTITIRLLSASIAWVFEKLFLDILCGNYATKPSKFLVWILGIVMGFAWIYSYCIGISSTNFQIEGTLYQTMNAWNTAWIYSLQVFLQIESGDLVPKILSAYYLTVVEKIIGLSMFSVFVVSYTRKVIK